MNTNKQNARFTPRHALGRHLTVDYYGCDSTVLNDAGAIEKFFLAAARNAGANVLRSFFHSFEPQGTSGMVIIAESHFSVHAWPEYGYAAVDIFVCSDTIRVREAIDSISQSLGAQETIVSADMDRGLLVDGRLQPLESH